MPALAPEAARRHYLIQKALAAGVVARIRTAWHNIDIGNLDTSWRTEIPRTMTLLTNGQTLAASQADTYLTAVLAEQGIDSARLGSIDPTAFAGTASDGRDLQNLLIEPVITTKVAIAAQRTVPDSLAAGEAALVRIVATQIQDAGRTAVAVGIAARPTVTSYTRMLNPPSCARCVILAGRKYKWNDGFQRHPHCFPAGVEVSGPESLATTRRWYEGELVIITTASGKQLPATSNHPILTDRGWLPAHLLQEGDHTVSSLLGQGARPLVVPDICQMPTRIEDVTVPFSMSFDGMPSATEDFHGDGAHGDVDVVLTDRFLWNRMLAASNQPTHEQLFGIGSEYPFGLTGQGVSAEALVRAIAATDCIMCRERLSRALLGTHQSGTIFASVGPSTNGHTGIQQSPSNDIAAHSESLTQAEFTLSGEVGVSDAVDRQRDHAPRWDAPLGPYSMEMRGAYASRGKELLLGLTGQVTLDRIVNVRRIQWSGHVYNLTSVEGWYSANGLIVSNCDCRHIPSSENVDDDLTTDPKAYFQSLSEVDQDRYFTKAGAETIRRGGDMSQVVNARLGMYQANGDKFTSVGTTKRGIAGKRLQGQRRMMPESILKRAGDDRELAVDMLRENGFLI